MHTPTLQPEGTANERHRKVNVAKQRRALSDRAAVWGNRRPMRCHEGKQRGWQCEQSFLHSEISSGEREQHREAFAQYSGSLEAEICIANLVLAQDEPTRSELDCTAGPCACVCVCVFAVIRNGELLFHSKWQKVRSCVVMVRVKSVWQWRRHHAEDSPSGGTIRGKSRPCGSEWPAVARSK